MRLHARAPVRDEPLPVTRLLPQLDAEPLEFETDPSAGSGPGDAQGGASR